MRILGGAEETTDAELRGMTPRKVDELIEALEGVGGQTRDRMARTMAELHQAVGDKRNRNTGWTMTTTEALRAAREVKGSAGVLALAYDGLKDVANRVNRAVDRLDAEFERRGRWTRAYLVTDGHVHSSRDCSTCNKGASPTLFDWRTELSGMTMSEIVEQASDRACTVCYPDAPVARGLKVPTSSLSTPEERDRQAERDARQRARQRARDAKAAKAALNAITGIDGKPLRENVNREGAQHGSILKTITSARTRLKDFCWYQYAWGDDQGDRERSIRHLARALAWREAGLPEYVEPSQEQIDAVIEPVRVKAVKEVEKARKQAR